MALDNYELVAGLNAAQLCSETSSWASMVADEELQVELPALRVVGDY